MGASSSSWWAFVTRVGGDSPPSDLNELAAYTRREREKFEALAEAHQHRMRELMSTALPLSPYTPASNAGGGGGFGRGGGETPASLSARLATVQRHFDEHRQAAAMVRAS